MTKRPEYLEHPSYGVISFSRADGNARRLYGSSIKNHFQTIIVRVDRSAWAHDLHSDRYIGRDGLIEIELSSAQFVEAITSMNRMPGVPCTIRWTAQDGNVPRPPDLETEVERIKTGFGDSLKAMIAEMQQRRKEVDDLTSKLPAKARERLRISLDVIIQQLESNVPFIVGQFNEASERIVTAAKHEIENFAEHRLREAGLEAIAERSRALLGEGEGSSERGEGSSSARSDDQEER